MPKVVSFISKQIKDIFFLNTFIFSNVLNNYFNLLVAEILLHSNIYMTRFKIRKRFHKVT